MRHGVRKVQAYFIRTQFGGVSGHLKMSDGQQLGGAARQPVRLGDGQHVAVAEEGEVLVQSCPLRHSGRLFAEHLLRSCGLQVALLRCQAGRLVPGARPTYRSAASVWWSCPWVASGSTSKLMLTILAGVATWEREIMLERQREGIAKAKAAGK